MFSRVKKILFTAQYVVRVVAVDTVHSTNRKVTEVWAA